MAKRFTDTDKWKKPFIRSLEAPYKLLWFYILDDCDHAGIWHVDMEVASIRIGHHVDEKTALKNFGERINNFAPGKWFIPDFIFFQYGELTEKNRLHVSVINILNKYKIKPLTSPLQGVKDKDKDKEQEKDKVKDVVLAGKKYFAFEVGELPETNNKAIRELISISKRVDLTADEINGLFESFKVQHLTGKKYYESVEDIYSHFFNSLQTKKINGTHQQVIKPGTSQARVAALKNW